MFLCIKSAGWSPCRGPAVLASFGPAPRSPFGHRSRNLWENWPKGVPSQNWSAGPVLGELCWFVCWILVGIWNLVNMAWSFPSKKNWWLLGVASKNVRLKRLRSKISPSHTHWACDVSEATPHHTVWPTGHCSSHRVRHMDGAPVTDRDKATNHIVLTSVYNRCNYPQNQHLTGRSCQAKNNLTPKWISHMFPKQEPYFAWLNDMDKKNQTAHILDQKRANVLHFLCQHWHLNTSLPASPKTKFPRGWNGSLSSSSCLKVFGPEASLVETCVKLGYNWN